MVMQREIDDFAQSRRQSKIVGLTGTGLALFSLANSTIYLKTSQRVQPRNSFGPTASKQCQAGGSQQIVLVVDAINLLLLKAHLKDTGVIKI